MNWNQLKAKLRPAVPKRTARFTLPTTIVEIQPDFVAGARLAAKIKGSQRPRPRLRSIGVAGLEPQTLSPLPDRPNVRQGGELRRALQAVAGVIRNGNGRSGLLVPDGMVRVSILSFETLPAAPREADTLIRWRMRENLPFPPEEARLSYQVMCPEPQRLEVLAVAAKGEVLAEYETAIEQINGGSALILPATLALLPLLPEEAGAQLLIHVCSGWITNAVVAGGRLRYWRNRRLGSLSELTPDQTSREAASEVARALASSCDRFQIEVERVWLCARPPMVPDLEAELARALSREVSLLAPNSDFGEALPDDERILFKRFGAPMAGLLSNQD